PRHTLSRHASPRVSGMPGMLSGIVRNQCPACPGTGVRLGPEYAVFRVSVPDKLGSLNWVILPRRCEPGFNFRRVKKRSSSLELLAQIDERNIGERTRKRRAQCRVLHNSNCKYCSRIV